MIYKGFRFGMLLQFAVGPVCLLVLRASAAGGFLDGLLVTLAAALIDALFIALSVAGAAAVIGRPKVKAAIRWIGCLTLAFFGLDMILSALRVPFLPQLALFTPQGGGLFWQGVLLTASNPLTILFWGSAFAAQTVQNGWNRRQLGFFAVGCVASTLLSLSAVAALGSVLGGVLPETVIRVLNALVGAALIVFGLKLLLKKETAQAV